MHRPMHRAFAVALAHLLAGTMLTLGLASPASAAPEDEEIHPEWGSTSAPDAVLRRGCKKYQYTYDIKPPEGDWSLDIRIKGPSGKRLAAAYWLKPDPLTATRDFRLCKATTRAGLFTIRAYLSVQNFDDTTGGYLPDSHFRLFRKRR